jgi:hypothetical protein
VFTGGTDPQGGAPCPAVRARTDAAPAHPHRRPHLRLPPHDPVDAMMRPGARWGHWPEGTDLAAAVEDHGRAASGLPARHVVELLRRTRRARPRVVEVLIPGRRSERRLFRTRILEPLRDGGHRASRFRSRPDARSAAPRCTLARPGGRRAVMAPRRRGSAGYVVDRPSPAQRAWLLAAWSSDARGLPPGFTQFLRPRRRAGRSVRLLARARWALMTPQPPPRWRRPRPRSEPPAVAPRPPMRGLYVGFGLGFRRGAGPRPGRGRSAASATFHSGRAAASTFFWVDPAESAHRGLPHTGSCPARTSHPAHPAPRR